MTLREQMETDVSLFLSLCDFAEEIVYNGLEIRAIVELGEDMASGNTFASRGQSARAEIWVAASDVPEPEAGDLIVAPGLTWQVARVLESGGGMHRLECLAKESPW